MLFLWAETVVRKGKEGEEEKEKLDGIHVVIEEEIEGGMGGGREWVGFFRRVERGLKLVFEGEGAGGGRGVREVVPLGWRVRDWCEMGVC